jgi:hypothetical protein
VMERSRLALVQQCVEDLWASRNDGRGHWVTLERTLIDMLAPKKKPQVSGGQAASNVIGFFDGAARAVRRRAERGGQARRRKA